jgi:Epoxide hydrolase N terminus
MSATAQTADDIRPFSVDTPEEKLAELRRRIAATRLPSRELVTDRSQGLQLATIQELARYWETDYDWRKAEAKLNAWPVTALAGPQPAESEQERAAADALATSGRAASATS